MACTGSAGQGGEIPPNLSLMLLSVCRYESRIPLQAGGLSNARPNSREIARAVGTVVRRRREALGLSQEDFAERTGHHRTYIGFLERGERSPNVQTLQRVAEALDLNASDLLRESGF